MTIDFSVEPLAEGALLLRFGDAIDAAINAEVHAMAGALHAAALPGVIDVAPAYASLLLRFDPVVWIEAGCAHPFERITRQLHAIAAHLPSPHVAASHGEEERGEGESPARTAQEGNPIEIPVCYDGDFGPDLEAVATHTGLSRDDVITRHTTCTYTVAMLGFAPGFPYLLGLDQTLHMPRRANPRTRVPAGSVAIGGAQTGIYPRGLPGGWNLLGCTPLVLFDPRRAAPALLAPGDRVRFRAIDIDAFAQLAEHPE